jgi:LacI family transcriptional regulator
MSFFKQELFHFFIKHDKLPDMNFKIPPRPPKIYVAIPTSGKDGQMRLAGLFRYLGDNHLWDLHLVRSRQEFNRVTLKEALRDGMDGFIVAVPFSSDEIAFLAAAGRPVVVMTDATELTTANRRISKFFVDNAAIGRTAARYFLSHGQFRSFAYVADTMQSQWSAERERAFRAAIGNKAQFDAFHPDGPYPEKRILAAEKLGDWLESLPYPTALLAANDHYAIQVLSICRARAIKVPRQISILGVDNDELLAENAVPSLSSIEPDFNEAGFCAAAEMDRLLRARKNPSGRKIVCGVKRLVERHSTTYLAPSAQLVANALAFIRRHAADGITPNDIARNLKVSRSLIELRMREVHGKSLAATLRERRLQLVKDLLRQTDRPIAKILSDCGYRNIRSAENIFKKFCGVSPRTWQQTDRILYLQ